MSCGTAPAFRTAICACVTPERASASRHSSTATPTSTSRAAGVASNAASGAAAPTSSKASDAFRELHSCWVSARAQRCTFAFEEPSSRHRAGIAQASVAWSRHSAWAQRIASSVSSASCKATWDVPRWAATAKTAPACDICFQSSPSSSHRLASAEEADSHSSTPCAPVGVVESSTSSSVTSPPASRS